MRFDAKLTGDAAALAQTHRALVDRLPATFQAFLLVELRKWATLFAPEQAYQRALLQQLDATPSSDLTRAFAGIARIEAAAGCAALQTTDPARFQDEAQALLRTRRLVSDWRAQIEALFQQLDPAIHARLHPPDAPRRLVVQLYGRDIAIQADKLWSRFRGTGIRVPLDLKGAGGAEAFLRALFGGAEPGTRAAGPSGIGGTAGIAGPASIAGAPAASASSTDDRPTLTLFSRARAAAGLGAFDAWIVESGEALHALCEGDAAVPSGDPLVGLSYERLRGYRDDLMRTLYGKIQRGVESPQAFAAYARGLTIPPAPGALLQAPDILQAFVRDVLLTGNGTLFVNNTFVEWAAVQALKRAQPRLLVARYGVRDRMKPFSSLLLFSQPRASDQIPIVDDPVGSFVDVEQLSYYVWLNAEKSPAYQRKTLYLFLAEGVDEMLAIRSDSSGASDPGVAPAAAPDSIERATLADVAATMAHWLSVPLPVSAGRPIRPLVA